MNQQILEMKKMIDESDIVSFDVFDTLVKRCVNTPETVFELVGQQFDLLGFSDLRQKYQMKASQKAERELRIPHADMNQIYQYISEQEVDTTVDWNQVKEKEIEIELECLYRNQEIYDVYQYALSSGKSIIITSDMYLLKEHIEKILKKCDYEGYDEIYVSSEVHATKYNGDIFYAISCLQDIKNQRILHIGDNFKSDFENPRKNGWNAIHYVSMEVSEEQKGAMPSPVDYGIAGRVIKDGTGFWYNLGALVGGPLYLGLCQWIESNIESIGYNKVFFLARDGYNLDQIYQKYDKFESQYLYMSRRSLLLAGITEVDEAALAILPPFTFGQTVREVLAYLGVENECGKHLQEAGLESLEQIINNIEDIEKVKRLYVLNQKEFLTKCEIERKYAFSYFSQMGFFQQDNILFDCGWNGSSQYLLERFLDSTGYKFQTHFLYVGILDSEKSRKQLKNRIYETYLFDYSHSRDMQDKIKGSIVLFELFFGAPQQSVLRYDKDGIVFENMPIDEGYKEELCAGIKDFVMSAKPFIDKYNIKISRENAISALIRLINHPTQEEAKIIGDLKNVDGFARQEDVEKYIAKLDFNTYKKNPSIEIYWLQGFMIRDDIDQNLKKLVAEKRQISFGEGGDLELPQDNKTIREKISEKLNKKYLREPKREYDIWIKENETEKHKYLELEYNPLISVVVPVYNVIDEELIQCIESVKNQTYKNWELILVDDASTWENVTKTLRKYETHPQIAVYYRKENGHISKTTNEGISHASGEFIAFMDCDDVLAQTALYEMVKKLNENHSYDFIYSDEDKLSEDGSVRHSPFFKPEWSPDTFMSLMYTNHLSIYRRNLVQKVGGLRSEFNGTQDYDFTFRFMECTDNSKVGHVPKILYHWRERKESIASDPQAKPYALLAMKKAKEEALHRRGLHGYVEYVSDMYQYRVVYENVNQEKVSIIIPFREDCELLSQCLASLKAHTQYENYEIIIVTGKNSVEKQDVIADYADEYEMRYYCEDIEFNYSKMCNIGARLATGSYLVFLNEGIEFFDRSWLSRLVGHAALSHSGAIGAKLLYPDSNIISHIGIVNLKIGPSYVLRGFSDGCGHYFGRNRMEYDILAVSGACLMVNKEKFYQVGGFDEHFTSGYWDVDLCFKLHEAGYYNVIRNDVVVYYYDPSDVGNVRIKLAKRQNMCKDLERLYQTHIELKEKDPFYNENLTQRKTDFSLNVVLDWEHDQRKIGSLSVKDNWQTNFQVVIDEITYTDTILISGWCFYKSSYLINSSDIYIILRDKCNCCTYFDVERVVRKDVAMVLKNNAYLAGYRCNIPYESIKIDAAEYQIGIMLISPFVHIKKICWTEQYLQLSESER